MLIRRRWGKEKKKYIAGNNAKVWKVSIFLSFEKHIRRFSAG